MSSVSETFEIHAPARICSTKGLRPRVRNLQNAAVRTGTRTQGILVTHHQPGRYTAAPSDQVPSGMIRELMH